MNEVLWEDTPTQNVAGRWASRDTHLGGRHIRSGDLLLLGIAAANGDPWVGPLRASSSRRVAAPISSSRAGVASIGGAPSTCWSSSAASSASSIPGGFSVTRRAASCERSSSRSPPGKSWVSTPAPLLEAPPGSQPPSGERWQ